MSSESLASTNHDLGKNLPPVTPPSGKFLAQLFLVPGIIVVVAVLIVYGFSWLVGGKTDPETLLDHLENPNAAVRWRAANEFAQHLKRDEQLAANPKVALRLTGLLRKALDDLAQAARGSTGKDSKKERETFLEKRHDIQFLCPCLGNLSIPMGAPLLSEIALNTKGNDPKTIALLRRQAVWALASLGDNLKRYPKLTEGQTETVLAELEREAALGRGERAAWARLTLDYLRGQKKDIGVIPTLAKCAEADDPFLRAQVAHALTFWEGDPADNALAEKTLLTLSRDDGHGVRVEIDEND